MKYILTDESIEYNGRTLYRIKAIQSFGLIEKDILGGYVESEKNLSQEGNCWVGHEAKVYGNAKVLDNATVTDYAEVYDNALVFDNALISNKSKIYGNSNIYGEAIISGNVKIYDNANIYGNSIILDNVVIYGNVYIFDNAAIYDNAEISGEVKITGNANISGDAKVSSINDYIVFKNWWSSGRYFTWTKSNNKYSVGCFYGTGEELIDKAYKDSPESGKEYERIVKYVNEILKK